MTSMHQDDLNPVCRLHLFVNKTIRLPSITKRGNEFRESAFIELKGYIVHDIWCSAPTSILSSDFLLCRKTLILSTLYRYLEHAQVSILVVRADLTDSMSGAPAAVMELSRTEEQKSVRLRSAVKTCCSLNVSRKALYPCPPVSCSYFSNAIVRSRRKKATVYDCSVSFVGSLRALAPLPFFAL